MEEFFWSSFLIFNNKSLINHITNLIKHKLSSFNKDLSYLVLVLFGKMRKLFLKSFDKLDQIIKVFLLNNFLRRKIKFYYFRYFLNSFNNMDYFVLEYNKMLFRLSTKEMRTDLYIPTLILLELQFKKVLFFQKVFFRLVDFFISYNFRLKFNFFNKTMIVMKSESRKIILDFITGFHAMCLHLLTFGKVL